MSRAHYPVRIRAQTLKEVTKGIVYLSQDRFPPTLPVSVLFPQQMDDEPSRKAEDRPA